MNYYLLLSLLFIVVSPAMGSVDQDSFDWQTITPTLDLEFRSCYDAFACGRLILPLDWLNKNNSKTVIVAIAKLSAVVPRNDPTYGGVIIVNPGGPGGSGVRYLLQAGRELQRLVDIPGKKHYDILSFDPRGTMHTEPRMDCFHGGSLARNAALFAFLGSGALDLSPASLAFGLATAKVEGQRCLQALEEFMPFVNTPSVARDMVAIVDKLDKLRQKDIGDVPKYSQKNGDGDDDDVELELRNLEHSADRTPRLQYIGFSYGAVLGNYFASLFPGRVGRMVLDGISDTDDFAAGPGWLTNTVDADEMMQIFFSGCFTAGPSVCRLSRTEDNSSVDISTRFWVWVASLDENPITILNTDGSDYIWRSGNLRALLAKSLYNADNLFQELATIIDEAMRGNASRLSQHILNVYEYIPLSESCFSSNDTDYGTEARDALVCNDGDDVTDKGFVYWSKYLADQLDISSVFGAMWTTVRISCANWPVRPNWSFKGPFKTPAPSKSPSSPEKGRPAAPLLFLSNRYDPVAPLRVAKAMAKNHPGSGLMIQEAMGHCAVGHGVAGPCTENIISEYFHSGKVPEGEVSCEGARKPWEDNVVSNTNEINHIAVMLRRRTLANPLGI